jgi:hypothetical protein
VLLIGSLFDPRNLVLLRLLDVVEEAAQRRCSKRHGRGLGYDAGACAPRRDRAEPQRPAQHLQLSNHHSVHLSGDMCSYSYMPHLIPDRYLEKNSISLLVNDFGRGLADILNSGADI